MASQVLLVKIDFSRRTHSRRSSRKRREGRLGSWAQNPGNSATGQEVLMPPGTLPQQESVSISFILAEDSDSRARVSDCPEVASGRRRHPAGHFLTLNLWGGLFS